MAGTGHVVQFLGLGSTLIGVFAEFTGVRLVAGDEQQRPGRDGLDVVERVEVHELHVAAQRWHGGGL